MVSILATGLLQQKSCGPRNKTLKYTITFLKEKHLTQVMALQEVIVQNLGQPDLLQPFSYHFMRRHMGHQGTVLGVFVENRLAAFRNLYYPDPWDREWNLGLDLELAEEELTRVANLQMVCVHPHFRGNGLALQMNQISLRLLRQRSTHHHICATVSPNNIWNIPNLLDCGFHIAKLTNKYGGKLRYVVHQDLRRPLLYDDLSTVQVRLDDHDKQKKWLASGYFGVALCRREVIRGEDPVGSFDLVFKAPSRGNALRFDAPMSLCEVGPHGAAVAAPTRSWPEGLADNRVQALSAHQSLTYRE